MIDIKSTRLGRRGVDSNFCLRLAAARAASVALLLLFIFNSISFASTQPVQVGSDSAAAESALRSACGVLSTQFARPRSSFPGFNLPNGCPSNEPCAFPLQTAPTCSQAPTNHSFCFCPASQQYVAFDKLIVSAPTASGTNADTIKDNKCRMVELATQLGNIGRSATLTKVFSGFDSGVYAQWPAEDGKATMGPNGCLSLGSTCNVVNPKRTPWYAASISGSKNIVIILDAGDSGNALRQRLLDAVSIILDTVSSIDYVTVITTTPNGPATAPAGNTALLPGTSINVDRLESALSSTAFTGFPNWEQGFRTAFDQIAATPERGCNTAIFFLSAGRGGGAVEPAIRERNAANIGARIFTYGFGAGSNVDILKGISCANFGVFKLVPDAADLETVMLDYLVYFATALPSYSNITWFSGQTYTDLADQPFSIASLACYDASKYIGVVGVIIPTSRALIDITARCPTLNLAPGDLERLRGDQLCTGSPSLAIGLGIGGAFVFLVIFLGCLGCCGYFNVVRGVFYSILLLVQFPILLALPWRPVFMIIGVFGKPTGDIFRRGAGKAFLHLGLFFLDIFTLPAFFITLVFVLDAPYMFRKMFNGKLYKKSQGVKAHGYIWQACIYSFRDAFLYYLLMPLTLIVPYRFVFLMIDFVELDDWSKRRRSVLAQFGMMVADLFTVPFFIITAVIAPWRWAALYRDFKRIFDDPDPQVVVCSHYWRNPQLSHGFKLRNTTEVFYLMWRHILSVAVDLILAPFIFMCLAVPFRFAAVAASFALVRFDAVSRWKIILIQALMALLDILTLPAAAIIFVTLYRLPAFRRDLVRIARNALISQYFFNDAERAAGTWLRVAFSMHPHRVIWREALQVFVDLGILILWVLTWIAPWRAVIAALDFFVREEHQGGRRGVILAQFYRAYLDIATLIPTLLQLITVYRVKGILSAIKVETTSWTRSTGCAVPLKPANPEIGGFFWSERALASRYTERIHKVIWTNFLVFCVDVLCLFSGPLTLVFPWRGFWFGRDVYLAPNARVRRLSAFVNLAMLALDLVTLPFFLVVVITIYRIPSLLRNWKLVGSDATTALGWGNWIRPAAQDENLYRLFHSPRFHLKIVIQAGHVFLDLLVILVALLTIIMPWRFVMVIYSVVTAGKSLPGQPATTPGWALHYRRMAPLIQFALMLLDILCLPFLIPVIATVFRFVIAIKLWRSEVMQKPDSARYWGYGKNMRTPDPSEGVFILFHSPKMHLIAFLMFVALMLEILGAVLATLTLIAPWRFVSAIHVVIRAPTFSDSRFSRLKGVSLMLLSTLLDYLSLFPVLIMLLTVYRFPSLIERWKQVGSDPAPKRPGWLRQPGGHVITPAEMHPFFRAMNTMDFHGAIWAEFARWTIDMLLIFSMLITIFVPWRLVYALSALSSVWNDPQFQADDVRLKKRRGVVWRQVWLAALDLCMLPILLILVVCAWRFVSLIYSIIDYNKTSQKPCSRKNTHPHGLILQQAGLLVMDVFVLIPTLILVMTVYRLPGYVRKVRSKDAFKNNTLKVVTRGLLLHKYLYYAFFNIMFDALAVVMFIVCVVTIFPALFLATDFSERNRDWFTWKHIRKHTVYWGLLTIPLWLTSPALILSFVMLPFTGALAWYFKFVHKHQPKPTKSYLLSAGKWLIKYANHKDIRYIRYWTSGIAGLVALVFFLFHWVMMLIVGFNFFFYSLLSFGLPFCPGADCWRSCCSCCHKGAFFITWWILNMPIFGFLQFTLWHLPRVIALFGPYWSTIFQLCSPGARADGNCQDFYNFPTADIVWWPIWLFWEIIYAHSVPYTMGYIYKYIWSKVPN